jgi:hypothetical protein
MRMCEEQVRLYVRFNPKVKKFLLENSNEWLAIKPVLERAL